MAGHAGCGHAGSFDALVDEADALVDAPIPPPERSETPAYALAAEHYIATALASRGDSHGEEHARIVRDTSLAILEGEGQPSSADRRIVELAALLHDVCDHKYCDPDTEDGREAIAERDMVLDALVSPQEAEIVLAIIDGVSFSKEAKGKLNRAAMPPRVRRLRDIVSDADKIEAIGAVGLRRCLDFRREKEHASRAGGEHAVGPGATSEELARDVAVHCDEKLLRLTAGYIRTEHGRKLAAPRHRLLCNWRARFAEVAGEPTLVSVVMTVRNCAAYLEQALQSVAAQSYRPLEVSLVDDGSTDGTWALVQKLTPSLEAAGVRVLAATTAAAAQGRGIGYGQNRAVAQSAGSYLCFLDGDDVCHPQRVAKQLALARAHEGTAGAETEGADSGAAAKGARVLCAPPLGAPVLVGCGFTREPADATPRYTAWINGLSGAQLHLQVLRELTVIHPTWFCKRGTFERLGGLSEAGPGFPEDLDFFYRHLRAGGALASVPEPLLTPWRHVPTGVTASRGVPWETIWAMRVQHLEATVLVAEPWLSGFTVWGAGAEGKRLFRSLSESARSKVRAFCDVDAKKLAHGCYDNRELGVSVPIVHFRDATPPLLLCVKDFDGEFARNVASLGLREGEQYLHFSF